MTAKLYNIRDYRRKEEKAATPEQIESEVMASLLGTPANFLMDDACVNSTDSQIASSPIGSSES